MKITTLFIAAIAFCSCKKNYTCTCPYHMPPAANWSVDVKAKNITDAVARCQRTGGDSCTVSK